jgi:hypothetical protein
MQELLPDTFYVVITGCSLHGDALLSCCDTYIMILIVIRVTGGNTTRVQFRNSRLRLLLLDENVDYQPSWRHQYPVIRTCRNRFYPWASLSIFRNIDSGNKSQTLAGILAIKGQHNK